MLAIRGVAYARIHCPQHLAAQIVADIFRTRSTDNDEIAAGVALGKIVRAKVLDGGLRVILRKEYHHIKQRRIRISQIVQICEVGTRLIRVLSRFVNLRTYDPNCASPSRGTKTDKLALREYGSLELHVITLAAGANLKCRSIEVNSTGSELPRPSSFAWSSEPSWHSATNGTFLPCNRPVRSASCALGCVKSTIATKKDIAPTSPMAEATSKERIAIAA